MGFFDIHVFYIFVLFSELIYVNTGLSAIMRKKIIIIIIHIVISMYDIRTLAVYKNRLVCAKFYKNVLTVCSVFSTEWMNWSISLVVR